MALITTLLLPTDFVTGSIIYNDHYPGEDPSARIVVLVGLPKGFTLQAIVDTGTPWCIFNPDIMSLLGFDGADNGEPASLSIRGVRYTGQLVRMMVELEAIVGQTLTAEATVFVPNLRSNDMWNIPNFIGLEGLLNRVRFAVDPAHNTFYFGEI